MDISIAGVLVLALDQGTKWWVRTRPSPSVQRHAIVRIRRVNTVRSAFRQRSGRASLVAGWLIALLCAIALLGTGAGLQTDIARLGAGAALGVAAGNLFDILRRRSVTDFIDLGWWPVFNIADVAIVAGLALAFLPLT